MSFPMNSLPESFQEDHGSTDLGDDKSTLIQDETREEEELDLSTTAEGVWLVKVPKFLMEKWNGIQKEGIELGRIRVYDEKLSNGEPKISILLSNQVEGINKSKDLPLEYKLSMQNDSSKNMFIFGEKELEDVDSGEIGKRRKTRITSLLGTIAHECSLSPIISSVSGSNHYSSIMRERQRIATIPKRSIKLLNVDESTSNRLASGVGLKQRVSNFVKVKEINKKDIKSIRIPQNELIDLLFKLFEDKIYWSLSSLKSITKQPETYLKETLSQIAILIKRGPYNGFYTLNETFKNKNNLAGTLTKTEEELESDRRSNIPLAKELLMNLPEPMEEEMEFDQVE